MSLIDQAGTNHSYIPDEYRPYPAAVQSDPTGRSAHEPGAKLDAGKNRVGLVLGAFALALQEVSKVGTFGANKYTDNGWLTVPNGAARYTDAMLRHHLQHFTGELYDHESNLLHIAHRCWNDLATLELYLREQKEGTLHAV